MSSDQATDSSPGGGETDQDTESADGVSTDPVADSETTVVSSDTETEQDVATGSEDGTETDSTLESRKAVSVIANTEPVFDFDGDGCLPSFGFDENGEQSGGLAPSGSLTGGCRDENFLLSSHTLHRYACIEVDGTEYCGHFYALYFLKDQITRLGGGHRHDWEYAAVWTRDGQVTHGSASAHGDLDTRKASELEFEGSHLKIVYHKEGLLTHALRFAEADEIAENPYGKFVTPPIVSWYELNVEGLSREEMRGRLNSFDYGKASIPNKDSNFLANLNEFKPSDYPEFDSHSVEDANPYP